jgi:hypothetical protein
MILCSAIRGRVGDRVYKTYGDKLVVTRVPRFDGYVPSVAQRQRREKMRAATAYAQAVYADPAAKAVYVAVAKQLGRQPFRLAVSDFLQGRARVALDATTTPRKTQTGKGRRVQFQTSNSTPPGCPTRRSSRCLPGQPHPARREG